MPGGNRDLFLFFTSHRMIYSLSRVIQSVGFREETSRKWFFFHLYRVCHTAVEGSVWVTGSSRGCLEGESGLENWISDQAGFITLSAVWGGHLCSILLHVTWQIMPILMCLLSSMRLKVILLDWCEAVNVLLFVRLCCYFERRPCCLRTVWLMLSHWCYSYPTADVERCLFAVQSHMSSAGQMLSDLRAAFRF